ALVEEAAAAAESLNDQAAKLERTVSVFKLDGMALAVPMQTLQATPQVRLASNRSPVKRAIAAPARRKIAKEAVAAGGNWEEF
ncbi:MAG: tar13, partial [Herminiimonas sp.]|nr:tar13 [Herminiimonas sp.]